MRRVLFVVAPLLALLASNSASATPEFPSTVDSDLMLTVTVESAFPTMGCRLCHPTESPPATNPPLKPFGQLLFMSGALPYNPASLGAALQLVNAQTPKLIDDLKAGKDPNLDDSADLPSTQTPEYGCAVGVGPARAPAFVVGMLLCVPFVRVLRRTRARQRYLRS